TVTASVNIAASNTTICQGSSVTFTATPTNGGTAPVYQWKVNGTNSGTNSNTFTSINLANNDVVTCVMTSNASCVTGSPATSNAITMVVTPTVTASVSITSSATTICQGSSVTFTATPTNGGTAPVYQWKVNGTNVGTNASTYTSTTLANGNTVTCVMTSNASCVTGSPATSNTIAMVVTPTVTASVNIAASNTTICQGSSVTFTATPTNGGTTPSYQWKVNGTNTGTNSNTFSSTSLVNNDVVTCVMTSNASCVSGSLATSNAITITVNPLPNGITTNNGPLCEGQNIQLGATGGTSYNWSGPNGFTSINQNPIINASSASQSGNYIVTITLNGCTSIDTTSLIVNSNPLVDPGTTDVINCYFDSVILNGSTNVTSANTIWNGPGIISGQNSLSPIVNEGGYYYLTVTDNSVGCSSIDSVLIIVDTIAPDLTMSSNQTLTCYTTQVSIAGVSSLPNLNYQWSPNGITSPFSYIMDVNTPGTYYLDVVNPQNGCSNFGSVNILSDTIAPNVTVSPSQILDCSFPIVEISGSSNTAGVIYEWTSMGNFLTNDSSWAVNMHGTYQLTVTDTINGCVGLGFVTVAENFTTPNVTFNLPDNSVCTLDTPLVLGGGFPMGGIYSGIGVSNGSFDPSQTMNNFEIIEYTYYDPGNGCASTEYDTIHI
ncbi:MAG: hypothetical protein ACK452_07920, partial [Bacteroidota bacterium]